MTDDEIVDLLTLMASYDRRHLSKADVGPWRAIIGDFQFADAWQAVIDHYTESTEWIMPAHLRQRVSAIRQARLDAAGPVEIPEDLADHPVEARAWKQAAVDAIADGKEPPLAIGRGQ